MPDDFYNLAGWPFLVQRGMGYIYHPVQSEFHVVDVRNMDLPSVERFVLERFGAISPTVIPHIGPPFRVACVTLTGRCNMHCPYCFVFPVPRTADMSERLATRLLPALSEWMESSNFPVYLWGGEPTQNPAALKALVRIATKSWPSCRILLTTNGCIEKKLLRWLANFDQLSFQVSFDGPPQVHSAQKRLKTGADSYLQVLETVEFLAGIHRPLSIRLTATNANVNTLASTTTECSTAGLTKSICIEPLHTYVGRAVALRSLRPSVEAYVDQLFQALEAAERYGVQLYSQPIQLLRTGHPPLHGIVNILPAGQAVSTVAIIDSSHPSFDRFYLGDLAPAKGNTGISSIRVRELEACFTGNVAALCTDCPVFSLCAGNEQRDLFSTQRRITSFDDYRCRIFRALVRRWIEICVSATDPQAGRLILGSRSATRWEHDASGGSIHDHSAIL